jgi:hypothetical protein
MKAGRSPAPQRQVVAPRVVVRLPAEALRGYVTFYYFVTADGPVDDFLYPEWGNVRFALAGDWRLSMDGHAPGPQLDVLCGPTDRCYRVTTAGGRVAGFGMTPLGWLRLIGEDADSLANRIRRLGRELGRPAEEMCAAFAADETDDAGVARFDRLLTDLAAHRAPESPQLLALDQVLRTRPADVPAAVTTRANLGAGFLGVAANTTGAGRKRMRVGICGRLPRPSVGRRCDPTPIDRIYWK